MSEKLDLRRNLPTSSEDTFFQVTAGVAAVRTSPTADGEMATHALHGETVRLAKEDGGFGLIQMQSDHYVGWVDMECLSAPPLAVTHRVSALRTYVYAAPDLKSAPRFMICLNAHVVVELASGPFSYCARAGWVFSDHLVPLGTYDQDPAAVATRYLGTPYLWGGKESLGLDCSGLVQMAFAACGILLPRDSDMQWSEAGAHIPDWQTPNVLKRNDLIFWEGHVGIMLDDQSIIHANAHHMSVEIESLDAAIERISPLFGKPIGANRIE